MKKIDWKKVLLELSIGITFSVGGALRIWWVSLLWFFLGYMLLARYEKKLKNEKEN